MVYFTSDTHYGHNNIVGKKVSRWDSGYRIFSSVEEMNDTIIDNINRTVGKDDILYHLGDVTMGNRVANWHEFFSRINCDNIQLILGNHDPKDQDLFDEIFKLRDISTLREININGQHITVCHFPFASWNNISTGAWMLYGHCHGSYSAKGKILDVGIDNAYKLVGEYRPLSFTEVKEYMDRISIWSVDHH